MNYESIINNQQSISSFWYTPPKYLRNNDVSLSQLELLCIKSWLDNGFVFKLYTYNLDSQLLNNIAKNYNCFELKDANEIVPFEDFFFDDKGAGIAGFSDYFRYQLNYKVGEAWADLDMICLKPFDITGQKYIFSQESIYKSKGAFITTSLLKFPQNGDFGEQIIQKAKEKINGQKKIKWGIIGPQFIKEFYQNWSETSENLDKYVLDYYDTCQIGWYEADKFIDKNVTIDLDKKCLHLFNEMWRVFYLNKNITYSKRSPYGFLINKYKVAQMKALINFPEPTINNNFLIKIRNNIFRFIKIKKATVIQYIKSKLL